jgi:hypothetical protein
MASGASWGGWSPKISNGLGVWNLPGGLPLDMGKPSVLAVSGLRGRVGPLRSRLGNRAGRSVA